MKSDHCLQVFSGNIVLEQPIQQIFPHVDASELVNCATCWEGPSFLRLNQDEWPTLHDPPFDDVMNSELSKTPKHQLLVMSSHRRVMHGGVNVTLTAVREKYWILRGKQVVKATIRFSVVCKKQEGPAYSTEPSPDLPDFRVSDDPPLPTPVWILLIHYMSEVERVQPS